MRIISGTLRGKTLETPTGLNTRPTSDKARQGVFNIIEHAPWSQGLQGKRVLDVFAGSGAMGLEALSRGAAFAAFIDNDAAAMKIIERNITNCRIDRAKAIIYSRGATKLGQNQLEPFEIAFLDAPYDSGLNEEVIPILLANNWLKPSAIIVAENQKNMGATVFEGLELLRTVNYGIAGFDFYIASASGV